jgi:hypothetical protein
MLPQQQPQPIRKCVDPSQDGVTRAYTLPIVDGNEDCHQIVSFPSASTKVELQ